PGPYSSMYLPEEPGVKPTISVRTRFMEAFSVGEASKILHMLDRGEAPMRIAQLRVLGGAAARVPSGATAFAHRQSRIMAAFLAMDGTVEAAKRHDAWAEECIKALPQTADGAYVNFLGVE